MKIDNFRSPLFYMGDKFKLLDQLKNKFPKKTPVKNTYEERFCPQKRHCLCIL